MSDIAGHGNISAWKALCSNPDLLSNRDKGDLYGVPFSHLFPELQLSPIELQIQFEISPMQLQISAIQL